MSNYFSHFPLIVYNKNVVRNIFVRLRLREALDEGSQAMLPYVVKEGERSDSLAFQYYGDSNLDWLIYLSNNYLDPDFDWPLDANSLNELIVNKYGSLEKAQRKILFYRINWAGDETVLNIDEYAALPDNTKKYWAPSVGVNHNIIFYERKKIDLTVATNQIIELTVDSVDGFILGERIHAGSVSGDIAFINEDDIILTVKNTEGVFTNSVITGDDSGTTASISNVNIINLAIPGSEAVFWETITGYNFEQEKNEEKRHIVLLDRSFASGIQQLLQRLLDG